MCRGFVEQSRKDTPYRFRSYHIAQKLSHMISLCSDEVEARLALLGIPNRFSEDEKAKLAETTHIVADHDLFVFPTPRANAGLNILMLRQLLGTDPSKPPSFFDHPWYLEEAFARENCRAGWHCVHRNVLPDSISQPINYCHSLESNGMGLPSAVEVTLMLFLHFAGTGEQLLQKKHTWCSDVASMNRRVTVGAFGRNGLFVSGHPPEFSSRGLGICATITNCGAGAP